MSNTNINGGPAFPVPLLPGQSWQGIGPCDGMTLRDYFAGRAMQSYLLDKDRDSFTFEQWAQASYEMADAMLKARETPRSAVQRGWTANKPET